MRWNAKWIYWINMPGRYLTRQTRWSYWQIWIWKSGVSGLRTFVRYATESHLKVQELTDGRVICKNDTFLGFRHGPKAVINSKTLVFLLFSNKSYVIQYETDLLESLNVGQKPLYTAGICETAINGINTDKLFILSADGVQLDEEFLPVLHPSGTNDRILQIAAAGHGSWFALTKRCNIKRW